MRSIRLPRGKRKAAAGAAAPELPSYGAGAENRPAPPRAPNPLVSPRTVARRALLSLVAIMSFLACLAIAAVSIVSDKAAGWQRQIADEVTIQIKPADGVDLDQAAARAADVAMQVPGVRSAEPLDQAAADALLEPWLGSDFDSSELPVPRLVAVRIGDGVDLAALARRVAEAVPSATIDDHGIWLERLAALANMMTLLGLVVLALVFVATALSVVFATRGAMAGNRDVIEVLHFVGAEDSYVAGQFQRHFLLLGLRGAGIGGLFAIVLFALVGLVARWQGSSPDEAQLRSLFGGMVVGLPGYLGAALAVLALAVIIAATAGLTVRRTLKDLD